MKADNDDLISWDILVTGTPMSDDVRQAFTVMLDEIRRLREIIITRNQKKASAKRARYAARTPEQREEDRLKRQIANREKYSKRPHPLETPEQRQQRQQRQNERRRELRAADPERARQKEAEKRQRMRNNPVAIEKRREYQRQWKAKRPEYQRQYGKAWRAKQRENSPAEREREQRRVERAQQLAQAKADKERIRLEKQLQREQSRKAERERKTQVRRQGQQKEQLVIPRPRRVAISVPYVFYCVQCGSSAFTPDISNPDICVRCAIKKAG